MSTTDFIDLAQPRIIVIRQGERTYSFTVKPITEARWFKYFDGIVSTAERDGKQVIQRVDAESAGLELADAVIVEGESKSLAHRLAIANVLSSAYAVAEDIPEANGAGREVYGFTLCGVPETVARCGAIRTWCIGSTRPRLNSSGATGATTPERRS